MSKEVGRDALDRAMCVRAAMPQKHTHTHDFTICRNTISQQMDEQVRTCSVTSIVWPCEFSASANGKTACRCIFFKMSSRNSTISWLKNRILNTQTADPKRVV